MVKKSIHSINVYDIYYIMSFNTPIPSVANNLKNIYLDGPLWDEIASEYSNDRNDTFGLLF